MAREDEGRAVAPTPRIYAALVKPVWIDTSTGAVNVGPAALPTADIVGPGGNRARGRIARLYGDIKQENSGD